MKKIFKYALGSIIAFMLILGIWFIVIRLLPPNILFKDKIAHVESVISKIEQFKREHGYYPPEDSDLIGNDVFYYVFPDGYQIGFSVGFDENYYYDSRLKKWSFEK